MSGKFSAPKGTVDLVGANAAAWERLVGTAQAIFGRYGYRPIYTPVFEHTEVFTRGIGEATDVVGKEMYTFTDKGDRSVTLRPENTASVVRAAIENSLTANGATAKLYYAGPMFRYERPQKGRQRQFYQLGAEALGFNSPQADAEMVTMLWRFFTEVGIPSGSMRLLVNSMGDGQCRPAYRELVADYIRTNASHLCEECSRRADTNPLRAFDCKNPACRTVMEKAPVLGEHLCADCRSHRETVYDLLSNAELPYVEDASLVRGLDYYTRTVFEVQVDAGLGAQNAIGGGGRYDGLFESLGGKPTPGIGFAIGFERTVLALGAVGVEFAAAAPLDAYIASVEPEQSAEAFSLTQQLRDAGIAAVCDLEGRTLKAQFKQADRAAARFVVILGPDELATNTAVVRDMQSGEERTVGWAGIAAALKPE